jgi:hypothetical protein
MTGNITSKVVSTSDGVAPFYTKKSGDADKKVMTLTFDGPVSVGTGKVTAKYYQEYGHQFIDIPSSDIVVTIKDNVVTISTPKAPAGAIVLISWEEGAFVDAAGNKCAALESGLNSAGNAFTGVNYQITKKTFELPRVGFTDNGKVVSTLPGTAAFDFNIYANKDAATGDISLIYKTATKEATLSLKASQWSVSGKSLTFEIPEVPANGTFVGLTIKEGTILDDLGNPNQAVTTDSVYWNFMTNFNYKFYIGLSSKYYNLGAFTLSSGNKPGTILLNNLYLSGSQVAGYLDLAKGKMYVENYAVVGVTQDTDDKGVTTDYGIVTYDLSGENDYITFTFDPSNNRFSSSTFALAYADKDFKKLQGLWIKPDATIFMPYVPATFALKSMTSGSRVRHSVAKSLVGHFAPNIIKKY